MSSRVLQIYGLAQNGAGIGKDSSRNRAAALDAADQARRAAIAREMRDSKLLPDKRIQLWESLYRVRLPLYIDHAILGFIASSTGLSVAAVKLEQFRRLGNLGFSHLTSHTHNDALEAVR